MTKVITKFPRHYLFNDDDIKIVGVETLNQSPILNVNINSSVFGFLESELENIHNTLKNLPDVPIKQHRYHMYCTVNGETPTLEEDVESALTKIREVSDALRVVCLDYYFTSPHNN